MDHVLLLGGAGYLGSVMARMMLDRGYSVTIVDNLRYNQALALAACCADPRFELVRGDMRDAMTLRPLVARADAVVNLAAIVGAPACDADSAAAVSTNRDAVRTLVGLLSPRQLLIYPNTNSAYGTGGAEPLTEDAPQRPLSLYARTKCEGEAVVLEHPNAVVFRLATVMGASPRMRTDLLVNDFVLKAARGEAVALYDGAARRNFVHVRDVADAILWAIDPPRVIWKGLPSAERIFNLGNDEANITKRGLCEAIRTRVPGFRWFEVEGRDPDARDYLVSNKRLAAAGFRARRGLVEGIDELLKLYAAFPRHQWGNV